MPCTMFSAFSAADAGAAAAEEIMLISWSREKKGGKVRSAVEQSWKKKALVPAAT
jgi:hypothetical protein